MKVITYRIKLLEPTLVTSLDGDPNSATAFDYLPGSVLRGAIIGKYLRTKNLTSSQFDAADAEARRLFFNGTARYLNGYPVEKNQRSLPVPQSWQHKKGNDKEIFDFAVESHNGEEDANGNPIQWQGVEKPFCLLQENEDQGAAKARLVKLDRLISVHTARDRKYGRARTESGAVYRYEALQAGQTFEAAILCDDADVSILRPLLKGEVSLGGSRSGGYGRVMFEQAQEATNWREVGHTLQPADDSKLIITLLSDALLRDMNGQFVAGPGTVTTVLSSGSGNIPLMLRRDETFLRGTTIGGFNRKWGLPLPQVQAVKMGSVFVYDSPQGDAAALRTLLDNLEKQGIGERRAEGFGRMAVNWHTEKHLTVDDSSTTSVSVKTISDANSLVIAQSMVARMLRQKLDAALMQRISNLDLQGKATKNSQLSRLRLIVHDALRQSPDAGRQRLNQYFESIESRQTTRKQFTRDRVMRKSLLEWLRERTADQNNIWSEIKINSSDLPKIGANVTVQLTAELAYEYNLRLIDGVLVRAAKERKGDN
jgi:CRISPR-associated protein Csx10